MNLNYRKFFRIATFIFLFFPIGIPAYFSSRFENILGIKFTTCGGGFLCWMAPNFLGWILVLFIYAAFFMLLHFLRLEIKKQSINFLSGAFIFIVLFGIFIGMLSYFGDERNYTPLRCAVIREGQTLHKSLCYYSLDEEGLKYHPLNESYCSKIPSLEFKEKCYQWRAYSLNDSSICSNIDDLPARDSCLAGILTTRTKTTVTKEKCDEVLATQEFRESCYLFIPSTDKAICSLINDPRKKTNCLISVASRTNDIEICKEIPGQEADSCYLSTAISSRKIEWCELTKTSEGKEYCQARVKAEMIHPKLEI